MTVDDALLLIAEYRAGLEAEMVLLRRLGALSGHQRSAATAGDADALILLTEQRDRALASLVAIEHGLKPIRQRLAESRERLGPVKEFQEVAMQHKEAAKLLAALASSDGAVLAALKEAESARQIAIHGLEQGESTLAAYRRVVAPPLAGASLVDRRG